MDDLTAFLAARLGEDEAAAKANIGAGPGWVHGLGDTENFGPSWPDYQTYDSEELSAAEDYLDRFRPLRVLREVEAKRAIVRLAAKVREWTDGSAGATAGYAAAVVGDTLRALAAVWSDHPDYRQEWKP